jgi:hypothetical protein
MMMIEKKGFVFKLGMHSPPYLQLALSYNHESYQTHGLLLSKPPEDHIEDLIMNLKSNNLSTSRPLHCAVLMVEFAIDTYLAQVETCSTELIKLEQVMGQHEWTNIPAGNPLELDYIATTRKLNFLVRILAVESMRLEGMLLTLERLAIYIKETARDTSFTAYDSGINISQMTTSEGSNEVEEKVAYLKNACQINLLRAAGHTKRVHALIQVVSSIFFLFFPFLFLSLSPSLSLKQKLTLKDISIHGSPKRQFKHCGSTAYERHCPGK